MCVSPSVEMISSGPGLRPQAFACGVCWQCRKQLVNDYVGRALLEADYSDWSCALTLTYRDDVEGNAPPGAVEVHKDHFTDGFIRSIRDRRRYLKQPADVRYFVCAEQGSKKGRVHYHAVLFGSGPRPEFRLDPKFTTEADRAYHASSGGQWPQERNVNCLEWPHGFVYADWRTDYRSFEYVMKYVLKDVHDASAVRTYSMSKRPILGFDHIVEMGRRDAALGTLSRNFRYVPPLGKADTEYQFNKTARREYALAWIAEGGDRAFRPGSLMPHQVSAFRSARAWLDEQSTPRVSLDEFLSSLSERLERDRPSVEQVKRLERSAAFARYTFDPFRGLYFMRDDDGSLVRVEEDGSERVIQAA